MIDKKLEKEFFDSLEENLSKADIAFKAYEKGYHDAMEQEPCEDAISRQAVIDATVKKNSIWNSITNSKGENLEEIISQLPPVAPQIKIGHWIELGYVGNDNYDFECSECHHTDTHSKL